MATGDTPMNWKWQKDGSDVSGATGSGLTATFTKDNVQSADDGDYTCIFTNAAGTATSDAATVTVS
ncbi:phage tail protein [Vibrio parahaemolyticus]|nr:phage tail protein [Vibrio parahaemolyticus]